MAFKLEKDWPRLSETLPHAAPQTCGQCGVDHVNTQKTLELWQEHDRFDRAQPIFFWLCPTCSEKIIEPHPRLYSKCWGEHQPAPGAMPLCVGCKHRKRTRCVCPKAKYNGGEGIQISGPAGMHGMIDGAKYRGPFHHYSQPRTGCTGKEA